MDGLLKEGGQEPEETKAEISMEEIFRSGEMSAAQGEAYQTYLQEFEGWTGENIEWAESLYQSDWHELYGIDPSAGSGGSAGIDAGQITAAELQLGDLGLMALPGAASNHVGIFVGCDESGRALWCHENSSAGNVSVDAIACFKYYFRMF